MIRKKAVDKKMEGIGKKIETGGREVEHTSANDEIIFIFHDLTLKSLQRCR